MLNFDFIPGGLNGSLGSVPSHELGSTVIAEVLRRSNIQPDDVSEVRRSLCKLSC